MREKQLKLVVAALATLLLFSGCVGNSRTEAIEDETPTWQEQYDLGVRYLSEGNYEEAIIAFTAAIEIDPKQAPAYIGRGDAYVGSVGRLDTETQGDNIKKTYGLAEIDYLATIDLDTYSAAVYSKLADIYMVMGDIEKAIAILDRGYEATGDEALHIRRQKLGISESDEVVWTDPVFEQLIREKIGITTGPVYVRDLEYIERLEIYGDTAVFVNGEGDTDYSFRHYDTDSGILHIYYRGAGTDCKSRGNIKNVDSLRYFCNLQSIFIIANHIADVSVLRELENLEYADFWANDISDLSPLHEISGGYETLNDEQFVEIGDILKTGD